MAYNKTINEGPLGTFKAAAATGIYIRCRFTNPSAVNPDGKPLLTIAGLAEYADVVTLQHIAQDAYGSVKFMNAGGEIYGIASGAIASAGLALYSAAAGAVSTTKGLNAVFVGTSTSPAADTAVVTYCPVCSPHAAP